MKGSYLLNSYPILVNTEYFLDTFLLENIIFENNYIENNLVFKILFLN
jgi:hypothetical protein